MSASQISSFGRRSPNFEVLEARRRSNTDSAVGDKQKDNDQTQTDSENDLSKSAAPGASRKRRGNSFHPHVQHRHNQGKRHRGERDKMVGENCQGGVNSSQPGAVPSILIDRTSSEDNDFLSTTASINMLPSDRDHLKSGSLYTPAMEDRLRRKLKFFFMDPCEKWKAKRRFPWKLGLQVLKILLLTIQLSTFGYERSTFVEFVERNTISFKHLFLKGWDPSFETMPYPPATGVYAIYEKTEVINHMNFALRRYEKTKEIALGGFRVIRDVNGTALPIELCTVSYAVGSIFDNDTFIFDSEIETDCFYVYKVPIHNSTTNRTEWVYDIEEFLKENNKTLDFDILLEVQYKFALKSVNLETYAQRAAPQCYKFNITITFDNNDHDGQMLVELNTYVSALNCKGEIIYRAGNDSRRREQLAFDSVVMLVSILSCVLCIRSLTRSQKLKREVVKYFKCKHNKTLDKSDTLEFWNFWYLLIICNDILTVVGSSFKIQLETRHAQSSSENYDLCSMMLGTGNLMAWFGVLRYLGFFKKYNILVLTLKKAFPNVLRFSVCALMLYFGFLFCGWVVLGPYHIKFRHPSTTSECLFSLINGDDMFVTFSATETSNNLIWYYSRIYLYIFISLFIYVVLSLFIAVIMDTYETIKYYYEHGFPKSQLHEFMDQCTDPPHSPLYRKEARGCSIFSLLPCCKRSDPDTPNERTRLLL